MTHKRQIDRLPIIPADAKEHNVTCHYCIVGCGYKAYTWPMNKQGGFDAKSNKFDIDLSKQQSAETDAWYAPSMYNVVKQNGQDVQLVIKLYVNCVVIRASARSAARVWPKTTLRSNAALNFSG